MTLCASGYMLTKSGDHAAARTIFEACARDGYTGTMTWMSQLDNNGLGGEYNPDAAAEWDRRAAEAGDPVGRFNYGLDLLRGHGVSQDEALGRRYVDAAAADGRAMTRMRSRLTRTTGNTRRCSEAPAPYSMINAGSQWLSGSVSMMS